MFIQCALEHKKHVGGVQPHKHLGAHCTVVLYTLTEHPD